MNDIKQSQSLEAIYFAKFIDDEDKIKLDPQDHESYLWIGKNELDKIVSELLGADDDEHLAIKKGFKLLNGSNFDWRVII